MLVLGTVFMVFIIGVALMEIYRQQRIKEDKESGTGD